MAAPSVLHRIVGFDVKVESLDSGEGTVWRWALTQYGKEIDKGWEPTEEKAKQVAWKRARATSEQKGENAKDKTYKRMVLRQLTMNRPHLVGGVTQLILRTKAGKGRCMMEAQAWEKDWWDRDDPKYRKPLPTHHRALRPDDAAAKLFDLFVDLGLVTLQDEQVMDTRKLWKWAERMFGASAFSVDEVTEEGEDDHG